MFETLVPLLGALCTVCFSFEMARVAWRASRTPGSLATAADSGRPMGLRRDRRRVGRRATDLQTQPAGNQDAEFEVIGFDTST